MTDNEQKPLLFKEEFLMDNKENPSTNIFFLYLSNYMSYWFVQTFLSVILVTGYAMASLVMEH